MKIKSRPETGADASAALMPTLKRIRPAAVAVKALAQASAQIASVKMVDRMKRFCLLISLMPLKRFKVQCALFQMKLNERGDLRVCNFH